MKKVFLTLTLVTIIAITTKAQVYIQGGLNLANITKNNDGQTEKNNILPSFNAGIMGRLPLADVFAIESGVLLTGRGSKAETYFNGGNNYIKTKFNPLYVEVPLNAVVKIPLSSDKKDNTNIFFNAGPYAAIGVGGTSRRDSYILGVTTSESSDIKFNDDDPSTTEQENARYDRLKRFDFGLNFGGGFQFNQFIIKANYGLGLAKINSTENNNSDNDKNKYRTFSVSVGFQLGK